MFRREEWKPGDRSVYVKFDRYRPRAEPASALAGGKVAHFDRIEWVVIADHQQAVNALLAGEIDLIENPSHDLLPLLSSDRTIKLWPSNPIGNQYSFRPNHLHKPFDNPKIRQALWYVFNQEDFLKAVIGDPAYYTACHSIFICPTRFASDAGMDGLLTSNIQRARQLLQEAGYDGTPITLLQSTDVALLANLAPVAKSLMEKAGFVVDLQAMDWSTLVSRLSRKDPPSAGGWHGYFTSWTAADVLDPAMSAWLNSRCERALVGWPCDPEMERLRDAFASETDPDRQKEWAAAVQRRAIEWTPMIPLGQWRSAMASRANITDVLRAPVTVLWNIRRQ